MGAVLKVTEMFIVASEIHDLKVQHLVLFDFQLE